MNHNLDLYHEDPANLIGRFHVNADKLVVLEVFQGKRVLKLDTSDWVRQIQDRIEKTNEADFITELPEDLAKCKINPGPDTYFLCHTELFLKGANLLSNRSRL